MAGANDFIQAGINAVTGNPIGAAVGTAKGLYNLYTGFQNAQTQQNDIGLNQDSQKAAKRIQDAFINNEIGGKEYRELMSKIGAGANDLDQNQRDYQTTQNQNRGTLGENALLSNVVQNATARQAAQQTAADMLATDIASNPLAQYNLDTDVKRRMALNNQQNLANNVTNQLSNLQAARQTNAGLIGNALQGGRAGLSGAY